MRFGIRCITIGKCTTAAGRIKYATERHFVFVQKYGGGDFKWKQPIISNLNFTCTFERRNKTKKSRTHMKVGTQITKPIKRPRSNKTLPSSSHCFLLLSSRTRSRCLSCRLWSGKRRTLLADQELVVQGLG